MSEKIEVVEPIGIDGQIHLSDEGGEGIRLRYADDGMSIDHTMTRLQFAQLYRAFETFQSGIFFAEYRDERAKLLRG
jgi:hypothetical protein